MPIFADGKAGQLNAKFERMFRALFGAVMEYMHANGWADSGTWVQVMDEPPEGWDPKEPSTSLGIG